MRSPHASAARIRLHPWSARPNGIRHERRRRASEGDPQDHAVRVFPFLRGSQLGRGGNPHGVRHTGRSLAGRDRLRCQGVGGDRGAGCQGGPEPCDRRVRSSRRPAPRRGMGSRRHGRIPRTTAGRRHPSRLLAGRHGPGGGQPPGRAPRAGRVRPGGGRSRPATGPRASPARSPPGRAPRRTARPPGRRPRSCRWRRTRS